MGKIIDIASYKIKKSLLENGFIVKSDDSEQVKVLIKINENNK